MTMLLMWAGLAAAACQSVGGDRITAKDFAQAVPEFAALPAEATLGYAPLPGAHRSFSGADVQRIAAQFGVQTSFSGPVCFEWPMKRLERPDLVTAMAEALGAKEDSIRLDEYSLFPAPAGKIVFPLSGLNRQAQGESFWRGYVAYAGDKHFNVWAKVKLAGGEFASQEMDVMSGKKVNVTVRNGAAQLKLEAQAMTAGIRGQTVTVRNPRSGRTFVAEVSGKDSVVVEAGEVQK